MRIWLTNALVIVRGTAALAQIRRGKKMNTRTKNNFNRIVMAVGYVVLAFGCLTANAEEWGDIKGSFIFDGEIPAASKINPKKDAAVCGVHNLVDESLVVNGDNKGIANVILYLYLGKKDKAPAVHESYKETESAEVTFVNENCEFNPRVALLRTSQTLVIGNKDSIGHNTNMSVLNFNPIVPAEGELKKQFPKEQRTPVEVSCNIHPWMKGWVVVKESPYFAVTDEDGKFEIKNVPAGDWTFTVWHEKSGYVKEVNVGGKAEKWKKGRLKVSVDSGGVDLGEVKVAASMFED